MLVLYSQEADKEYESTTNNIEEFTYDENNVLKTIIIKNEYNYSTKELIDLNYIDGKDELSSIYFDYL